MSIDPTAVTPGATAVHSDTLVDIKCRKCEATTAKVIKIPGRDRVKMFQCTKCSHTWSVDLGGVVDL